METTTAPPTVLPAFDDTAAYVSGELSWSRAITLARDEVSALREDFTRSNLCAVRVYMRPVGGEEAQEFFWGEFDEGWVEVCQPLNDAQKKHLFQMWKVQPR